jgi:ABC-type multidrug transport system fused ATPase/permease subunit
MNGVRGGSGLSGVNGRDGTTGATAGAAGTPGGKPNLWRALLRLFWFQRGWYLLFAALTVGLWALALVPAFLARALFDALAGEEVAPGGVYGIAVAVVMVEAGRTAANVATAYVYFTAANVAKSLVRANLLERILTLPGTQALARSTGDAVARFRDDVDLLEAFLGTVISTLGQGAYAAVALGTMLRIDTVLTLVVFVPLAAVVVAARLGSARLVAYRAASRDAAGRVAGSLGEMFGAVQAIKLANAEDAVIHHFRAVADVRRRSGVRDRVWNEVIAAVFGSTVTLGTGLILLLAGQAMRAGTFGVGDLALFTYFLGSVTGVIGSFGTLYTGYKRRRSTTPARWTSCRTPRPPRWCDPGRSTCATTRPRSPPSSRPQATSSKFWTCATSPSASKQVLLTVAEDTPEAPAASHRRGTLGAPEASRAPGRRGWQRRQRRQPAPASREST